jgi:ribosomal protein L13
VIQGKDKPTYAPNRDDGDMCIVLNAKDLCVTGRKLTDKTYHWHTGQVLLLHLLLVNCSSDRKFGGVQENKMI